MFAVECNIRRCRQIYRRFALVSTNPTSRGKEEIDAFHPLYGLHYLSRKDLSDFLTGEDRTQWLKIEKGKVRPGLISFFRFGDILVLVLFFLLFSMRHERRISGSPIEWKRQLTSSESKYLNGN